MSVRRRVSKLEQYAHDVFVVACEKYYDRTGNRIPWSAEMHEDAVVTIRVNKLAVHREQGEDFEEFQDRANMVVREKLHVTIWLHPSCVEA